MPKCTFMRTSSFAAETLSACLSMLHDERLFLTTPEHIWYYCEKIAPRMMKRTFYGKGELSGQSRTNVSVFAKPTHQKAESCHGHDLHVLVPHLPSQSDSSLPERQALIRSLIRPAHQQIQPLASIKDLLDVLRHDVFDACELLLCGLDRI